MDLHRVGPRVENTVSALLHPQAALSHRQPGPAATPRAGKCHLPSCTGLAGPERKEGSSHPAMVVMEGWLVPSTEPPVLWEALLPLLVLTLAKACLRVCPWHRFGLSVCPEENSLIRSALCACCSAWYESSEGGKVSLLCWGHFP